MTETPQTPTKVEEKPPEAVAPEKELFSVEQLEELINAEDPDFNNSIRAELPTAAAGQDVSIDLIDLDALLSEEEGASLKARLNIFKKRMRNRLIVLSSNVEASLMHFLTVGFLELLKNAKNKLFHGVGVINEAFRQFSYWPRRKKLAAFGLIAGVATTGTYIYVAYERDLLPQKNELFETSLENGADLAVVYDPDTESEAFYDSPRASQNLIVISRIVVNIRPSPKSGPTPMAAFEFFLEGNSPDVMVEIKDREYEVRDLFQRDMEEMTFDELESIEGKQLLAEKLRREINRILTKGRVRKVFFKTAILKP